MIKKRQGWRRWGRFALVVGEVLAVIATVFALFEVFFARRIAPIHTTEIATCDAQGAQAQWMALDRFLTAHSESFVYLNLDLAWLRLCGGGETPYEEEVLIEMPSGYIEFNRRDFRNTILSRYETAEDYIDESLIGLYYVTNKPGEGLNYFNIVPAPFDSGTQRMQVCTQAFTHETWRARMSSYIGNCIFS